MYRVIVDFYDMQDGFYTYFAGDKFPRDGFTVGEKRLAYLASKNTRLGVPVIEKVAERKKKTAGEEK